MAGSQYIFYALAIYGIGALWGLIAINGTLVNMIKVTWYQVYPTGTPHHFTWTGIWPIDFMLGQLVCFFYSIFALTELPDDAPFLLGTDLLLALVVFNVMSLVEDRRNRKTGSLRVPIWWQTLWNFFGAACVLPIYMGLYIEQRAHTPTRHLPAKQAQALPLTALWAILISLPTLIPGLVLSTPYRIQAGVVMWLLGPFTLGPIQDLISYLMPLYLSGQYFKSPIKAAYAIVGTVSGIVHIAVLIAAMLDTHNSIARVYLPQHSRLIPDTRNSLMEGAMLFTQYDYIGITLTTLTAGYFMARSDVGAASRNSKKASMTKLVALSTLCGPGATMAWLLRRKEDE